MTYQRQVYELYGIKTNDLSRAKEVLEKTLGVEFESHESLYLGNYFRWGRPYGKEMVLQANFNNAEEAWSEEQFKDFPILLYVNQPDTPELLEKRPLVADFEIELLRKEEL